MIESNMLKFYIGEIVRLRDSDQKFSQWWVGIK